MTHYDPIVSVSVTRASGKQEELRRCGLMPHTFASYVGSIFEVSEVTQFLHNSHAAVRVANRTISARYLVADAWWPEWQSEGESVVQHDRTNPFAVGIDNLKDYADAYKDFAVTLVVKDGVVHAEVTTPGIKIRCKFCADEAARVAVENP